MSYLGIDLGTTNSAAVIYRDKTDSLETVSVDGEEIMPSIVSYCDDEIIVGSEAKAGAVIYPETTVISVKKLMGSDETIKINDEEKTPEEVSAQILKKLKVCAEEQANEVFDEVVITHPAYFNDRQIFATKQAGIMAGFKSVYLLSEPLAAAIEYGYRQGYAQTLLVYDIGGGTFDACVLRVSSNENGEEIFTELSDVGDMNLGGDDFDNEIIELMKSKFEQESGINIDELEETENKRIMQKLKQEAEQTKKKLSSTNKVSVKINPLMIYNAEPKNLVFELTKEEFEAMIRKYVDKSRQIVEQALSRAKKEPDEISKVILVGGSTLIPMVKRMVAGYIKEPYRATDPAKSVAMGASIYNHLIHLPNSNVKVGQVTRQIFGTQAITDITKMKKELIPIIPMGTPIPCKISDSGFENSGSNVNIKVYQWEDGYEDDKKYIGSIMLENLEKKSRIELTYSIDEDNLFRVYAKDEATGILKEAQFDRNAQAQEPEEYEASDEKVNVVFIIDTTGSMDTYINGVKDRAIEFSEILSSKGADFKLGLIGFGDLYEKEKPTVYDFTDDVDKFKKQVKHIPRTYGGDVPESSLEAVQTGIEMIQKTKPDGKTIFILITDAPPHVPTVDGKTPEDIKAMLEENEITAYVAARRDRESIDAYTPIAGGKYYNLNQRFSDILDNIAKSISELVRVNE